MTDWPDEKIRSTALWYIRKHSKDPTAWRWTRLGEPDPEVLAIVHLHAGELPVVSFFRSAASWYLFTTRRILGSHLGNAVEVGALEIAKDGFGNFKGHGGRETEVMTLQSYNGSEMSLEYETFTASMAPIYYMMYWKRKYPVLDNSRPSRRQALSDDWVSSRVIRSRLGKQADWRFHTYLKPWGFTGR